MSQAEKVLVPSHHYEAGDAQGLLSAFDPGTRVLPAGFRVDPKFRSLPVDIVLEKDIAVTLRDGVRIYVDVLRPAGTEQVPVIVAWSPYGKSQGTAPFVTSLFGMIGLDNSVFYPGEQLRLVISAQNALGAIMPGVPGFVSPNSGQHVIHTGGSHASYLQLPIKAATELGAA